MTATTFDTLGYFEKLATKSDLLDLKHEILKWVVGVAIAQSALIIAVLAMR